MSTISVIVEGIQHNRCYIWPRPNKLFKVDYDLDYQFEIGTYCERYVSSPYVTFYSCSEDPYDFPEDRAYKLAGIAERIADLLDGRSDAVKNKIVDPNKSTTTLVGTFRPSGLV